MIPIIPIAIAASLVIKAIANAEDAEARRLEAQRRLEEQRRRGW